MSQADVRARSRSRWRTALRRVAGCAVVLAIAAAVVAIRSRPPSSGEIERAMLTGFEAAADEGGVADLSELLGFDWETMYAFEPYATKVAMEAEIGFTSEELVDAVGGSGDVVVFTDGREVVATTSLPFHVLRRDSLGGLPREQARFRAERFDVAARDLVVTELVRAGG